MRILRSIVEPHEYWGKGRIRHQSALSLLKHQKPASVGAIITDPPFFINIGRNDGPSGGQGVDPWSDISDIDAMIAWSEPIAKEVMRTLKPGGASLVMGSAQSIAAWEVAAQRAGLKWMADIAILWNTGKPRRHNFGSLSTIARWHTKPGWRHTFNSKLESIYSNILVVRKIPIADRVHSAQKPVELTNFFVSLLTNPDDLVIDPFCGSGSTLVSASMCGRPYLGCDTDNDACNIAVQRLRKIEIEESELNPIYLWVNNKLEPIEG